MLADEILAPLRDQPCDVLPEHAAVAEPDVLDVAAAFVRGLDEAEDTAPVPPAGAEERLQRVAAEVWVDGHGVRHGCLALEVRSRVGAGGRADIAALAVRDHEQAGRARVLAGLLEGAHAVGTERLEERELRLDRDRVRRNRVDDPAAEARNGVGCCTAGDVGITAELDRQEVEPRIEADDELRALALDCLADASLAMPPGGRPGFAEATGLKTSGRPNAAPRRRLRCRLEVVPALPGGP